MSRNYTASLDEQARALAIRQEREANDASLIAQMDAAVALYRRNRRVDLTWFYVNGALCVVLGLLIGYVLAKS